MNLYTEKSTRYIYDVKLFNEFVMVRPVSRVFGAAVDRMSHDRFSNEFEEYSGLYSQIEELVANQPEPEPDMEEVELPDD